ncbi:murein L,D-transpeptidase family protein [Haloferula sp. A504]|uniref:murein L,D-transpeptidase family protein n=1 Tax=Haloferula sp. A504 TaxID=3373601 RepID=UPI0031BF1A1E|nr:murein L,D-transpeptidase [Verrucomicrobiaceae bacterium E54]
MEDSVDSSLPGPERAAAAAARVKPLLAPALAKHGLAVGDPVFLRAFKEEKELEVWMQPDGADRFVLFRTYPIAATSGKPGPKLAEGDRQVPEGFYYFSRRGLKSDSRFHLAMNIGYPNTYDRHHGRTGSFIMIHGNRVSIGCLAMTDPGIEEIYTLCDAALAGGQRFIRVHLFPFRMTDARMKEASSNHRWIEFWRNLKEGHDHFEQARVPPDTVVEGGRYGFRGADASLD